MFLFALPSMANSVANSTILNKTAWPPFTLKQGVLTQDETWSGRILLTGDVLIFNHLREKLEERYVKVPKIVQGYIQQKLEERQERHVKFGASMYLQEPNVKESIGGIRDLHNVFWVLRLKYGSMGLDLTKRHHLLTGQEAVSLEDVFLKLTGSESAGK